VEFSFSINQNEGARTNQEVTLDKIIISIESESGELVLEDEELSLSFKDAAYITDPISFNIGNYAIVKFLVVGEDGVVQYATPLEGSDLAYLVETPLPIEFTVSKDEVIQIIPEVVSTEEGTVEDFGYGEFTFDIIETFDVLVGVFVYDVATSGHVLTSSDIVVYADGDSLTSQQLFAATNKLTFPDRFAEFQLIIEKEGYNIFDYTYSADSIKSYQGNNANGPLEIVLISEGVTEGLVAYYPFNGNANDESGNGLDGTVNGATLTTDRNGNANEAYSFDGMDDYIQSSSDFDSESLSVNLWFKRIDLNVVGQETLIASDHASKVHGLWGISVNDFSGSPTQRFNRNGNLSDNQLEDGWHMVTMTYNVREFIFYINGLLIESGIDDGNINSLDGLSKLTIGTSRKLDRFFEGDIDDIRIYDRALSEAEILVLAGL